MLTMRIQGVVVCVLVLTLNAITAFAAERWTPQQANEWYDAQPWLVGCNFLPSNAINQLEMWQPESFDAATIDRELGWAESLGFNTVRVFLHDLPWHDDRDAFLKNIDKFLEISAKHKIRPMIVFFDGVWDPDPQSGKQNRPRAGVHNSGWVQSPGRVVLADNAKQDALEPYVTDVLKRYAKDKRVLAWDLFNEPDNLNGNSYGPLELKNKDEVAARLVREIVRMGTGGRAFAAAHRVPVGPGAEMGRRRHAQQSAPGRRRVERRHLVPRLRQAGCR